MGLPVKINMMCGKRNFGPDWVSIDMADFPHINSKDIHLKNYETESVDFIYCSHGIAYFDREEIKQLLAAWKRVLKPGAVLRISTTDWDVIRYFTPPIVGPIFGRMQVNDGYVYHKTIWDFVGLSLLLNEYGFKDIHKYDHCKTIHPNTGNRNDKYDDHSAAYIDGILISLNVECNA